MSSQEARRSATDDTARADRAAFVDVDNTLLHGASLFVFGRGAVKEGIITFRQLLQFAYKQFRFKRVGENPKHMVSFRARALQMVAGRDVAEIEAAVGPVCAKYVAPKIWPEAKETIRRHLDRGDDVWLVTATPVQIADEIAKAVRATGVLATIPEERDGVFTGKLVGTVLHGPAKAVAVRRLAAEHGYSLEECTVYSDSVNDLPLFELVGHPVATNPDKKLRQIAAERRWPILSFRKRSGRRGR